ncbi:MAG: hypothetical protein ACE5J6_00885 [Candidatus Bathyarchaeia archaeon]
MINGRIWFMESPEKRVVGSLLLLSGLTFLAIGLYTGQLAFVLELLKKIFETAIAGLP